MRKLLGVLFLGAIAALFLAAPSAFADGITYTVQGTYGAGTISPGNFTLTFTVPATAGSQTLFTSATDSEAHFTLTLPAEVNFFSSPLGGLFDISLGFTFPTVDTATRTLTCFKPCEIESFGIWEFYGPQIFTKNSSGQFSFLPGTFPISPGSVNATGSSFSGSFFFVPDSQSFAAISGGTVTGSVAAPEPSSLLLLGVGLFALTSAARKRRFANPN